jgi:HK97 family phage portal protein
VRSLVVDAVKSRIAGAVGDYGYGNVGAYGERYEPETRQQFVDASIDRVWTARCIALISKSTTQVNMQVRTGEDKKKDWSDEHPLIDLLNRPSHADPAMMFFEWSLRWAETLGEWHWEVVPSRRGSIAELYPLRSHMVRVEPDGEGGIKGYVYDPNVNGIDVVEYSAQVPGKPTTTGPGGEPILIAGRYASPKDDYYGMGPLRAAKDSIISEYYGVRYDHRFFRNSARPDVVIGFKGKMDKDQRRENRQEWQQFKGVDKSHKAAVMDGDPNVQLLSQNPKEVEYLEGRRLSREEQCAAFGVPPVLVGDLTRATYSNYEVSEYIFWKTTMLDKLKFFATWVNFVLLPYFPDVKEFGWDISEISALQRVEGWRSERITGEIAGGVLTPNEGRELLDREPKDEDGADELWIPTKSRPIKLAYESPKQLPLGTPSGEGDPSVPPPATDPGAEGPAPVPDPEAVAKAAAAAGLSVKDAFHLRDKQTVIQWLRNANEAKARFSERTMGELAKMFAKQRKAVVGVLTGEKDAPSIAEIEQLLTEYGWGDDAAELHAAVEAMQAGLTDAAFKLTSATVDHTASFGLTEKVLNALANRPDGIGSVVGRVKAAVLEQVRTGIEHGLTFHQIAAGGTFKSATEANDTVTLKGVTGVYDEYEGWQGERIARTEAGHTFNRASAALMGDAGITDVDIIDGEDDEPCKSWNGTRRTLAEYEADPLAHPNCTRIGLPVIEGTSAA